MAKSTGRAMTPFEREFARKRALGEREFEFDGKMYSTKRKDRPDEVLTPAMAKTKKAQKVAEATPTPEVKRRPSFDPSKTEEGLESVDTGSFVEDAGRKIKEYAPAVGAGVAALGTVLGGAKALAKRGAKKALDVARGSIRDRDISRSMREAKAQQRSDYLRDKENKATSRATEQMEDEGGGNTLAQANAARRRSMQDYANSATTEYRKGGAVKHRGDGIAKRGHTKGRYI